MKLTAENLKPSTAKPGRQVKHYLLLFAGTLNVMGGALMAAAPHLQSVMSPQDFAYAMIGTGVVTAGLAFVSTQLKTGEIE